MPYDYKYLVSYPTKLGKLSLLNSTNRDEIKKALKKNESKNFDLKKYFVSNYYYFSNSTKQKILNSY